VHASPTAIFLQLWPLYATSGIRTTTTRRFASDCEFTGPRHGRNGRDTHRDTHRDTRSDKRLAGFPVCQRSGCLIARFSYAVTGDLARVFERLETRTEETDAGPACQRRSRIGDRSIDLFPSLEKVCRKTGKILRVIASFPLAIRPASRLAVISRWPSLWAILPLLSLQSETTRRGGGTR